MNHVDVQSVIYRILVDIPSIGLGGIEAYSMVYLCGFRKLRLHSRDEVLFVLCGCEFEARKKKS